VAKASKQKPSKRSGEWKVKRQGETEILLTIPPNFAMGDEKDLTIEDVLVAIAISMNKAPAEGMRCCGGNLLLV
jgi:hypothetical protein